MPADTNTPLTARQQEIWQFLVAYVDDHGYPPTVREIGEEVGLASPSTVHAHLANRRRIAVVVDVRDEELPDLLLACSERGVGIGRHGIASWEAR